MMSLLKLVRDKISDSRCLVTGKLQKAGCEVKMTNVPAAKLVIDFDKPGSPLKSDEKRCDYLLIAKETQTKNLVAVLELKRGQLDAEKVVSQLRAGAKAAEKLIPKSHVIRFRPVAVTGSTSKFERNKLRKIINHITFHSHQELPRWISCGNGLEKAL
ncbi:MAG: hypothetical protein OXE94_03320 [Aestuariivita sp.]|nr:hypothetical protein [Aestuariivita sp.]MCY4203859.1 hypothetical protein [Aestuariivita sp.]